MGMTQKLLDRVILALAARRRAKNRSWHTANRALAPPAQDDRDWQGKFKASLRRE